MANKKNNTEFEMVGFSINGKDREFFDSISKSPKEKEGSVSLPPPSASIEKKKESPARGNFVSEGMSPEKNYFVDVAYIDANRYGITIEFGRKGMGNSGDHHDFSVSMSAEFAKDLNALLHNMLVEHERQFGRIRSKS